MEPSLYIHIPFCRRKCLYCNFYSCLYDYDLASSFIETIITQLSKLDRSVYSIYIGGGTPSVLDRRLIEKLLAQLKRFSIKSNEFTFEANPDSLDAELIDLLLRYGVNRLSIGLQSFDERKVGKLGRLHSAVKAKESVYLAQKRGFKNISVDLIFGVWEEKLEDWKKELKEVVLLPINHVSCYELTYEKNTPLYEALRSKDLKQLDDELTCAMYEAAIDVLALGGFQQYEVSNFAKAGCESRHNMNYWENNPYIGLGPSAVSYIDGRRTRNVSDAKGYVERFGSGKGLAGFSEKLSPVKSAKETAAVKIRTRDGIDFEWFKGKTGFDFQELEKKALPKLLEDGLIEYKRYGELPAGICLTRKGFLFCDTVSSVLL
jgi:oxygen-independent coproporphyrinogen-3 oxidase